MKFVKFDNGCHYPVTSEEVFGLSEIAVVRDGWAHELQVVGEDGWYVLFELGDGLEIEVKKNHQKVCREAWPEEVHRFVAEAEKSYKELLWEVIFGL